MKRYEESLQCFDEIITKQNYKDDFILLNKGAVLIGLDRNEEAIGYFDEIIYKLDPKYVDAWFNKGVALDRLGKYEEAIQCYDKALEIDSRFIYASTNKKIVEEKLRNRNE